MAIEVDVIVRRVGSDRPLAEIHFDENNLKDLGKDLGTLAQVVQELQKVGKLFGFG